ncbi:MAG: CinA family protein [Candidatus Dormibacteria bacterium]
MKREQLPDLQISFPGAAQVLALATRSRPVCTIASAESCTGGLLGAALTAVPGSSRAYLGGVVAYSNRAKVAELGVGATVLRSHGAVSHQVAQAMAEGARSRFGSVLGIGVTGVAGPQGSESKPPGLIYLAVVGPQRAHGRRLSRDLGRQGNRGHAVEVALALLREALAELTGAWPELFEGL